MHEIHASYKENQCQVKISGEPYILINLEQYWQTQGKHTAHCDFIFIQLQGSKYRIFLVELKDLALNKNLLEIVKESCNKFVETHREVNSNFVKLFNIEKNNVDYFCILALPAKAISALLKRLRLHTIPCTRWAKKNSIKCWIATCGKNILEDAIILQ